MDEERLGLPAAIAIVAGSLLGPVMLAGRSYAPIWVWIGAGAIVLSGAMAIGAIAETGGPYVLLREAFGPVLAYCCGWTFFFAVAGGIVAWLAATVAAAFPVGTGASRAIAILFIAILTWVNHRSLQEGARLQIVLVLAQLAAVGLALRAQAPQARGFYPEMWLALFAGWPVLTFVAGEVRDRRRTLPRAYAIGLVVCIALYAIFAGRLGSRLSLALLAAGAANAWIMTAPWISVEHARDRLFFNRFAEPPTAILMLGVWAATLALTGMYKDMLGYALLSAWFFYGMTGLAGMKVRRRGSPLLFVPFALLAFGLVIATARVFPGQVLPAAILVASGVPVYFIWRRFLR